MIWFLHGNLGTPQDGEPLVAALTAAGYKVQSPCLWTLLENGGETLETAGEQLAELILKTDPAPILCAYSLGARVALHALPHLAPHCRALILIGVHPGLDDEQERSERRFHDAQLARRLRESSWEDFLRNWNSQPVFRHSKNSPRTEPPAKTIELMARAFECWSLGTQENQTPTLAGIIRHYALPTLIVSGEKDKKFRAIATRLAAALPGALQAIVLCAGHRIPEDMPEELARILCAFLKHSLPPSSLDE